MAFSSRATWTMRVWRSLAEVVQPLRGLAELCGVVGEWGGEGEWGVESGEWGDIIDVCNYL